MISDYLWSGEAVQLVSQEKPLIAQLPDIFCFAYVDVLTGKSAKVRF